MTLDNSSQSPTPQAAPVPEPGTTTAGPPAAQAVPQAQPVPPTQPITRPITQPVSPVPEAPIVPPAPAVQTAPAVQVAPPEPAAPAAVPDSTVPAAPATPAAPVATAPESPTAAPAAPSTAPAVAASAAPAAPSTQSTKKFALVVDDEPANRDFLVRLLEQAQLEVKGACDAADALNKLSNVTDVSLIAVDQKLPDMDGVDLLVQLRSRFPQARLVMATMHDDRALMEKAFANGCDVFLVKPHGFMELFRRVQLLDNQEDGMTKLVIDQYGPHPYRG